MCILEKKVIAFLQSLVHVMRMQLDIRLWTIEELD